MIFIEQPAASLNLLTGKERALLRIIRKANPRQKFIKTIEAWVRLKLGQCRIPDVMGC